MARGNREDNIMAYEEIINKRMEEESNNSDSDET